VSEAHEDLQDLEDGFGEDGGRQRRGLLRNPGVVLRPNHGVSDRDVRGVRTGDHGMQAGVCKKCRAIKPVRAHHCHVCDRCILNVRTAQCP
jgi:ribosomal protein L40E